MPPATRWRQRQAWLALLVGCCSPLLVAHIAWRGWIRQRPIIGWWDKLVGRAPRAARGAVVLHGVSLGEVNLLMPIAEALRAAGERVLITTTTSTGWEALCKKVPEGERAFLPFDLPWATARFLATVQPRALLLFELELWPLLLGGCHQRRIPVALINGRIGERSFAGYRRAAALFRPLCAGLRLALAQNGCWGARLRHLGVDPVIVTGSLKADMVRPADPGQRDTEAERLGLPIGPAHSKRILLGASTGPGEEGAIWRAWRALPTDGGWRLVLCPRHPERGAAIASELTGAGITAVCTAGMTRTPPPDAVVIVDEIGRLSALYANAAIAVVGGSLGSGRGGQNMLEAAAAGCATVVGPDTRNQPDGMALLRRHAAVLESDPELLASDLRRICENGPMRRQLGSAARSAWLDGRGCLARVLEQLHARLGLRCRP